jgi:hypothetical protein
MGIEVRVCLIDLKRAFRRLIARLPDESEAGGDFVDFGTSEKTLDIVVGGTSEVLNAIILHPGQGSVPLPVFCGIARILRFHRGIKVDLCFSEGRLKMDRAEFRHPGISISFATER